MLKPTKTLLLNFRRGRLSIPFVSIWLGGQQFTLNEVTDSPEIPRNVVAFINAWREKKDVWHSPNNDPRFGVRVKDVSLYEYHVGQPKNPEELNKDVAPAEQPVAEA